MNPDVKRLTAKIEALEWVIQTATTAALQPLEGRSKRRSSVLEHLIHSVTLYTDHAGRHSCLSTEPKRALISVKEAARVLGIGRSRCYELIRRSVLPSVQLGRRRLVPRHLLLEWVERGVLAE